MEGVGTLKMLRKYAYIRYILNIQELLLLLSSALRGVGEGSKRYRIIITKLNSRRLKVKTQLYCIKYI